MKYVALLSGGKDSCFNLLHCMKHGHDLVAAASLGPPPGKEELDSYLYQTVGQDAVEFVARALEVPLFRRVITGQAVQLGPEYGSRNAGDPATTEGDETEDLFALLSEVKGHHPDVLGVAVGAILSSYQRVRVEHVCRRLGLTPLCYLWNRDQGELLDEMIDAGMEAVIIKVAGIGLTMDHLGKTLGQMRPTLLKQNALYGSHICGEGGEYESLTLDSPMFKHRIVLSEVETVIHSDNAFATVAFIRVKKVVLEPKTLDLIFDLRIPPLLESKLKKFCDDVKARPKSSCPPVLAGRITNSSLNEPFDLPTRSRKLGPWLSVSGVQRAVTSPNLDISLEDEVRECFSILREQLKDHGLSLAHCVNINIFLSSLSLFDCVNAVYTTFFGSSPPARACVGVDLLSPIRVRLDCIAFHENVPSDRQALHVQGLSYWAPANIGPYSQAIMAGGRIFISGQIGLIPSHLTMPSPLSVETEIALASQHVLRVTQALKPISDPSWFAYTQAALYWLVNSRDLAVVKRAYSSLESAGVPALFLVVKDLPKGALVEKQVLLHTGFHKSTNDDDDIALQPIFTEARQKVARDLTVYTMVTRFETSNEGCRIICVKGQGQVPDPTEFVLDLEDSLSIRLFYSPSGAACCRSFCQAVFSGETSPPVIMIPCRAISTIKEDDWDFVLCILTS